MKKFFIYALVGGLAAGLIYLLCKKKKTSDIVPYTTSNKAEFKPKPQMEDIHQTNCVEDEVFQTKNESTQAINERHSEAVEIIKDAYQNIMEDFVEDFSNEVVTTKKEIVIDGESVSVINELDAMSDELDDLLK